HGQPPRRAGQGGGATTSGLQRGMAPRRTGRNLQGARRYLPHRKMSIKSFGERIADVLIEDGLLLPSQLAEAMDLQKKQGGRLLKLLTDKQYVTEQDMVISMGRCLDVPPINLSRVRVPEEVQDLVPKDMARQYKLAPICKLGNKLFVAMADPL